MSETGDGPADDDHGFTLFEMLVVMAITGLVAGIAFPAAERALRGLENRTAIASAELALRSQRAAAIRSGRAGRITPAADGKALIGAPGPAWPMPDGVTIAMPRQGIAFFPDGSSSGGTVRVTGRMSVRSVSVTLTGMIR